MLWKFWDYIVEISKWWEKAWFKYALREIFPFTYVAVYFKFIMCVLRL